jgi:penicillin-binding protein 1C
LDRNHEVIHESRLNSKVRQLEWVPLTMISPALREAVLASEDHRFYSHQGVDWFALAKAAVKNLMSPHLRGASTLSMQLASLLDQNLVPKRLRRGVSQKVKQIQGALKLEQTWNKEQIQEAYFNLVPFRGELRGIAAACYGLFGKAPHAMDLNESLILAALIRSPEAGLAMLKKRACELGTRMKGKEFSCEDLHALVEGNSLGIQRIRPVISLAPHVVPQLQHFITGQRLDSSELTLTLDRDLQRFTLETLQKQILSVREKNVHDAAALVVHNTTGEVLAYVGGIGALSSAIYVDGVQALRQAGSTLKPFLYALAFDQRYLTPSSFLDDSPLDIPIVGGVYRPRNYDHSFHGDHVTARMALASSLNVPAVRTLNLIGVDSFVDKLKELGLSTLRDSDYYGPSLALGSADVSLWNLVNAYRVLARGGKWSELRLEQVSEQSSKKSSTDSLGPKTIFSPEASFLISDILSDRESRSMTFGLENPLALRFWAAVKTGTSKDMRDNWCIGYSQHYTVGVWVGNFSGEPMWNVTGVTGAAPAWHEIMKRLHSRVKSEAPRPPQKVVRAKVLQKEEWFIRGTEPTHNFGPVAQVPRVKITYPVDGMIIARDPDIPRDAQRVYFESNGDSIRLRWILNGRELPAENSTVKWQPVAPGDYQVSLADEHGKILDSVHFLVR